MEIKKLLTKAQYKIVGDEKIYFQNYNPINIAKPHELTYCEEKGKIALDLINNSKSKIIITNEDNEDNLTQIEDKTLIADKERCLCIYGIDYIKPDTKETISRYGFVGLLKLVDIFPARDGVIPHERTFQKFTQDRLQIIRQTDANFSPIFMIYNGNGSAEKIFQKFINLKI